MPIRYQIKQVAETFYVGYSVHGDVKTFAVVDACASFSQALEAMRRRVQADSRKLRYQHWQRRLCGIK